MSARPLVGRDRVPRPRLSLGTNTRVVPHLSLWVILHVRQVIRTPHRQPTILKTTHQANYHPEIL